MGKSRIRKHCAFCSKEFEVIPSLVRVECCSRTCAMKLKFRDDPLYNEVGKFRPAKGEHRSLKTEFKKGQPLTVGSVKGGEHRSPDTEIKKREHRSPGTEFKKGWVSPKRIEIPACEELKHLYLDENLSTVEIGAIYGVSFGLVSRWIHFYGIPVRGMKERAELVMQKPGTRAKCSISRKKLIENNPEIIRICLRSRRPTDLEAKLISIIDKNQLPYKYTGDGSFIVGGKNPDFVNTNSAKVAVDIFGDYWHEPNEVEERQAIFASYGWSLFIMWESDLKTLGENDIVQILKNAVLDHGGVGSGIRVLVTTGG